MGRAFHQKWSATDIPIDPHVARRRIAQQLRTGLSGVLEVRGPDGMTVHLSVDRLFDKFWDNHKYRRERWPLIPLIEPVITSPRKIIGSQGAGEKLYSAALRVGTPGHRARRKPFALYALEDRQGRRQWLTIYQKSSLTALEDEEQEKLRKGRQLWPPLSTSGRESGSPRRRNPPPAQTSSALSRAGRLMAAAVSDSTPREAATPRRSGLFALGVLAVLGLARVRAGAL